MTKRYTSKREKELGKGRETNKKDLVRLQNRGFTEGNRTRQAPIRNTHDVFLRGTKKGYSPLGELSWFFFFPFVCLFGNKYYICISVMS